MAIEAETHGTVIELEVAGMHCQSCVALIEEVLAEDPRVGSVHVDLEAGRATVAIDGEAITVDELCAAIVGTGYEATPLSSLGS